jgi:hypothetical protein
MKGVTRFDCREIDENTVAVTTPIGVFRIKARRAKKGDPVTSVVSAPSVTASGDMATEDQTSLPISIAGRLNAPSHWRSRWTYQPSHFIYADGTSSDFLGMTPMDIEWEAEPDWPVNE